MGSVYLGRRLHSEGEGTPPGIVAIKGLHPHLARNVEFVTMLLDEARLVQCIDHPNVVKVHELVDDRGEMFVVMEYIHGQTVSAIARRFPAHRPPLGVVLAVVGQALEGLAAAHEARDPDGRPLNLIHRDISPQNIIVGVDGVTRILDFGVAKAVGRLHETREGVVKGKLSYMAPEILTEAEATQQVDVYGLGVVLWELLTGTPLFSAENEALVIGQIINKVVPPPSDLDPSLPPAVDEVVLRALARDPKKRFSSARELATALAAAAPADPQSVAPWLQTAARERLEELDRAIEGTHPEAMLTPVPRTRAAPSDEIGAARSAMASDVLVLPPLPLSGSRKWASRAVVTALSLAVLGLALTLFLREPDALPSAPARVARNFAEPRAETAVMVRSVSASLAPTAPAKGRGGAGAGKPPGSCFVPDSKGTLHIRPECL